MHNSFIMLLSYKYFVQGLIFCENLNTLYIVRAKFSEILQYYNIRYIINA